MAFTAKLCSGVWRHRISMSAQAMFTEVGQQQVTHVEHKALHQSQSSDKEI